MKLVTISDGQYSQTMTVLDEYEKWQRAMGRQPTTLETTRKVISRFLDHSATSATVIVWILAQLGVDAAEIEDAIAVLLTVAGTVLGGWLVKPGGGKRAVE